MPKIIIKSVPPTFYRGGKQWTREGVELDATGLTSTQLEAIRTEANLVVSNDEALIALIAETAAAEKAETEGAKKAKKPAVAA